MEPVGEAGTTGTDKEKVTSNPKADPNLAASFLSL